MAEFDALFAQAIAAPVMPLHGTSLEALRTDGKKRAEQYRAVGVFIAQHCHVLIALWDGDDREMAAGGSAEVVTFKRRGIPLDVSGSARISLDASEVGPVIDIVTPRVKETSSTDQVSVRPWGKAVIRRHRGGIARRVWRRVAEFAAHLARRDVEDERARLSPEDRRELETWESFEALIDLTRQFNRDAAALAKKPDGPARMAQSVDYLFTDPEGGIVEGVDAKTHAMGLAPLWCRLYAIADTLALERQSQFKWDWKLLFGFGFIAFFCFAMFTHAGYVNKIFLGTYLATFVVLVIVYLRAVLGQHQERYLDYRALAEALRVAVYWKLLGIGSRYRDAKIGLVGPRCDGRCQSGRDDRERLSDQAAERACLGEGRSADARAARQGRRRARSPDRSARACHCPALLGARPIRLFQAARIPPQQPCRKQPGRCRRFPAAVAVLLRAAAAARRRARMERLRRQACGRHRRRLAAGSGGGVGRICGAARPEGAGAAVRPHAHAVRARLRPAAGKDRRRNGVADRGRSITSSASRRCGKTPNGSRSTGSARSSRCSEPGGIPIVGA